MKKNSGRWPSITFHEQNVGYAKIEGPDAAVLVSVQLALTDNDNYHILGSHNIKVTDLINKTVSWLPPTQTIRVIRSLRDKVKGKKSKLNATSTKNGEPESLE